MARKRKWHIADEASDRTLCGRIIEDDGYPRRFLVNVGSYTAYDHDRGGYGGGRYDWCWRCADIADWAIWDGDWLVRFWHERPISQRMTYRDMRSRTLRRNR